MPDYSALREAMEASGFQAFIRASTIDWELPDGEFCFESDSVLISAVRDLAKAAAARVWKDYVVLVTRAYTLNDLDWYLRKV